jgi:protein-tyrosine phosphatase
MPRPRAGDWLAGEVASWRQSGLDVIVSLLETGEVAELGLDEERSLCEQAGVTFLSFPIPDRGLPESVESVCELVHNLVKLLREGRGVGIHCRMGLGRSAMIAACVLVSIGSSIEDAWKAIEAARHLSVPDTPEQRDWVSRHLSVFTPAENHKPH